MASARRCAASRRFSSSSAENRAGRIVRSPSLPVERVARRLDHPHQQCTDFGIQAAPHQVHVAVLGGEHRERAALVPFALQRGLVGAAPSLSSRAPAARARPPCIPGRPRGGRPRSPPWRRASARGRPRARAHRAPLRRWSRATSPAPERRAPSRGPCAGRCGRAPRASGRTSGDRPAPNPAGGRSRRSARAAGGWRCGCGRRAFFVDDDRGLVAARFDPASGQVLAQETLFTIPADYAVFDNADFYDITSDDQRFLMVRPYTGEGGEAATEVIVVPELLRGAEGAGGGLTDPEGAERYAPATPPAAASCPGRP